MENKRRVIILDTHKDKIKEIEKRVSKYELDIKSYIQPQEAIMDYMKELPYMFIIDPFMEGKDGIENPELGLKILEQFSRNNAQLKEPVKIIILNDNVEGNFGTVLKKMRFSYLCKKSDDVSLEKIIEHIFSTAGEELPLSEVSLEVELPADPVKELLMNVVHKEKDEIEYLFTEYPRLDPADPRQRDRKRLVLRNLIKFFWIGYQEIALYAVKNEREDLLYKSFLRFRAILSLEWLSPNIINIIAKFIEKQNTDVPNIYYTDEYLQKIWSGEILPAYNDIVVQEFRRIKDMYVMLRDLRTNSEEGYLEAVIRYLGMREIGMLRSTRKSEKVDESELMRKGKEALFAEEVTSMLKLFTNMCIGPQGNKLPILNLKGEENIATQLTTKPAIQKIINEVIKIDPGIFKRTRLNEEKKFQEYNIEPYIIILPCIAAQGVCWDPWHDANKRTSPGHIGVPIIFERTLEECVFTALAHLRWRTAKNEADIYWMEEGITGHYYQYYEEFKKRRDEEGNSYVASLSGFEDSFVEDYITWIKYESKGQLKLRREVRDMFWILIPFSEDVKKNLTGRGQIYEELLMRDERRAKSRFTSLTAQKENKE